MVRTLLLSLSAGACALLAGAELAQCPYFEVEATDTDMSGTLIAERWAETSDDCCPMCEEAEGCEGFAFASNVCYLKSHFSGTYPQAGVVSRITTRISGLGCPGFSAAQHNQDLAGTLIEHWYAQRPELCCEVCAKKSECQGFAFLENRCYLKGNVQGMYNHTGTLVRVKEGVLTPEASTPMTIAPSPSAPPHCPAMEAEMTDTDLSGDLIAQVWASTSAGCCPLCEEAQGCHGFAYLDEFCYLKGNFSGTYYQAGVVSRITARVAGHSCPGFAAEQQDRDLAGGLLEHWFAENPELCCAACARKPECQGFAFLVDRCYLKGNVTGTYNNTGVITRVREGVLLVGGSQRRLGGGVLLV